MEGNQPSEPQGIFTPPEEPVEVDEVIPPQKLRSNTTAASGKGDIKLPGEKGSKKRVFVILISVIVILGIIVAALFIATGGIQQKSSTNLLQESKKRFDQYATFVLFGEKGDSLTGEFSHGERYKLSREFVSERFDASYWDEAKKLLASALEEYTKVNNPINPLLAEELADYQNLFLFVNSYLELGAPREVELLATMKSSGADAAKTYVANYYSKLTDGAQPITAEIANQLVTQYQAYVDLLDFADDSGCINDNKLDLACAELAFSTIPSSENSALAVYEQSSASVRTTLRAIVQELERRCWSLSQQFDTPPEAEGASTEEENA